VVFTSGYTENAIVRGGQTDPRVHLVNKPWRTDELARRLRSALAQAQAQARAAPARMRILLVEDDGLVRTITADILTGLGYEVMQADSAEQALTLMAGIDLLIADVELGSTDGLTLAASVRAMLPGLPVIMASGHPEPATGGAAFTWLAKPYDDRALRAALAKATGAAG
jgi:CheY-like chemotaxis protein